MILVVNGNNVTGSIRAESRSYIVQPLGAGFHAVIELDPSGFPPDEPEEFHHDSAREDAGRHHQTAVSNPGKGASNAGGEVVDLLVVYTPGAASASGDINGLINGAVDITNAGFGNSLVPAAVAKVHQAQVSYTASGNVGIDVARLAGASDGYRRTAPPLGKSRPVQRHPLEQPAGASELGGPMAPEWDVYLPIGGRRLC